MPKKIKNKKKKDKKTKSKSTKHILSGAKNIDEKRKEGKLRFSLDTTDLSINTYSSFKEPDLKISFNKIDVYFDPLNIVGTVDNINENTSKSKRNEYGNACSEYLLPKKQISLLELYDKGILFALGCRGHYRGSLNQVFLDHLVDYIDNDMKILKDYFMNTLDSSITGSIYFDYYHGSGARRHSGTSNYYKIHISVKLEYLFDALKLFSEYSKLTDLPAFKIVFPKFQHSEYKNLPEYMNLLDNPYSFLREYEELAGATASANIVIYPTS